MLPNQRLVRRMAKTRKILHLDLDAFFCSVAEQLDPEIKGKAVVVGAKPSERGAVASASYPARRYGIKSAMPMGQALRLCPDLIIVRPNPRVCVERSKAVMDILLEAAPLVEPTSIDDVFADVTILRAPIGEIAQSIQRRVNTEVDLPCSLLRRGHVCDDLNGAICEVSERFISNTSNPARKEGETDES